jgi:hypothetical protein
MDGLSAASSIFAVVSLAIQLGDGFSKLCSHLVSIKDATQEILSLINELQFLANLLDQVKRNEETFGSHEGTREALALCLEPLESLNNIAESLVLGVTSKRKLKRK